METYICVYVYVLASEGQRCLTHVYTFRTSHCWWNKSNPKFLQHLDQRCWWYTRATDGWNGCLVEAELLQLTCLFLTWIKTTSRAGWCRTSKGKMVLAVVPQAHFLLLTIMLSPLAASLILLYSVNKVISYLLPPSGGLFNDSVCYWTADTLSQSLWNSPGCWHLCCFSCCCHGFVIRTCRCVAGLSEILPPEMNSNGRKFWELWFGGRGVTEEERQC